MAGETREEEKRIDNFRTISTAGINSKIEEFVGGCLVGNVKQGELKNQRIYCSPALGLHRGAVQGLALRHAAPGVQAGRCILHGRAYLVIPPDLSGNRTRSSSAETA